jgi:hypothetical protein
MVLGEIKVNLVLASSTKAGIINQSSNQIRRNTTLFSLAQRRSINLYYPSYEVRRFLERRGQYDVIVSIHKGEARRGQADVTRVCPAWHLIRDPMRSSTGPFDTGPHQASTYSTVVRHANSHTAHGGGHRRIAERLGSFDARAG